MTSTPYPGSPTAEPVGYHRASLTLTPVALERHAGELLDNGFRLALVAGHDDGDLLRAVYLFTDPDDQRVELHLPLRADYPHLPSLAGISFPTGRFEREMHDLYGVIPDSHPLPRRLVRHFHWPKGWYPMRHDAGDPPEFGDTEGPFPFRSVEGDGVYEIPVGPVHAGLIEPGHFASRWSARPSSTSRPGSGSSTRESRSSSRGAGRPMRSSCPTGSAATPPSATPSPSARRSRTPSG
ncbi:NADH-quinone oxidoreductase subunit C [Actinophytocola sp.]|uniref:NADH-quinone oxidoreductase subunit C n=1 Tax=Actinophytocola sp. TaxID=1872138 RepID=UPI003D6C20FC